MNAAQKRLLKSTSETVSALINKATNNESLILNEAQSLRQAARFDEAVPFYKRALSLNPKNKSAQLELAEILSWKMQTRHEAIDILRRYVSQNPEDIAAQKQLATILSWSADTRTTLEESLRLTLKLNPADFDAHLALANLLNWTTKWPEAETHYRAYLGKEPADFSTRVKLADLLHYEKKSPAEAAEQYALAIAIKPSDDLRLKRLIALLSAGETGKALPDLRKLAHEKPFSLTTEGTVAGQKRKLPLILVLAQNLDWRSQLFNESAQYYRQYLNKQPHDWQVRLDLAAMLHYQLKDRLAALSEYRRVLVDNPGNIQAQLGEVMVLLSLKEYEKAVPLLERLSSQRPGIIVDVYIQEKMRKLPIIVLLAQTYNQLGEYTKAEKCFRTYLSGRNDNVVRHELANMLSRQEQRQNEALIEYDKLLKTSENDSSIRFVRAMLLVRMKQYKRAIADLRLLASEQPSAKIEIYVGHKKCNVPVSIGLARALKEAKEYSEALQIYRSYLRNPNSDRAIRHELADVLASCPDKNRQAEALAEYNKIIDAEPDDLATKFDRAMLLSRMHAYKEAIGQLRCLITQYPSVKIPMYLQGQMRPMPLTFGLARALAQANEFAESEECYRQYITLHEEDLAARLELAVMLASQPFNRGVNKALDELDQVMALGKPGDVITHKAQIQRALSLAKLKKYDEALAQLDVMTVNHTATPIVSSEAEQDLNPTLARASILRLAGKYAEAQKELRTYAEQLKGVEAPLTEQLLADSLAEIPERRQEALAIMDSYLAIHPKSDSMRFARARTLNNLRRPGETVAAVEQLLQEGPQEPYVSGELARAYKLLGDDTKAIATLEKTVLDNPNSSDALDSLAAMLIDAGNAERAVKLYQSAVNRFPERPELGFHLARALSHAGNQSDAQKVAITSLSAFTGVDAIPFCMELGYERSTRGLACLLLEQILKANPDNLTAMLALGKIQTYNLATRESGLALLEKCLKLKPGDQETTRTLADACSWSGRPKEAVELYRQLLLQDPTSQDLQLALAKTQANAGATRASGIRSLKNILEINPYNWDAQSALADALRTEGQSPKAIAIYEKLLLTDPHSPQWQLGLARAQASSRATRLAGIANLRDYLERRPGDVDAHCALAEALSIAHKQKESCEIYKQLLVKNPDDLELLLGLARIQLSSSATRTDGINMLRQYLSQHPDDFEVQRSLADVLAYTGKSQEAVLIYDKLVAADPQNTDLLLGLARAESASAKTRSNGLKHFKEYLALFPDDAQAERSLADVFSKTGKAKQAIQLYQQSSAEIVNEPETLLGFARLQIALRETRQNGIESFLKYLNSHPEDLEAKKLYADALSSAGDYKQAISIYNNLLIKEPQDPEFHLGLARVEEQDPKTQKDAITDFESYLKLLPEEHDVEREMAMLLGLHGQLKRALAIYDRLIVTQTDNASLRVDRANLLTWTGHIDEAMRSYKQILAEIPDDRQALVGLAGAFDICGFHLNAEKVLRRARDKYPDDVEIEILSALNFRSLGRLDKALVHAHRSHLIEDREDL